MADNWQARMIVEEIEAMADDLSDRGDKETAAMFQCLANRFRVRLGLEVKYECRSPAPCGPGYHR